MIAVQNLTADGILPQDSIEHLALTGSLKTMSQVLNDVLDLFVQSVLCAGAVTLTISIAAIAWILVDLSRSRSHSPFMMC